MAGGDSLIGKRADGEAYLIGLDVTVDEVKQARDARGGSRQETADYLGLPLEAVEAALDYEGGESRDRGSGDETTLGRITKIAGLFGALATIVYVTGGIVLALRLNASGVDPTAVIGQLPREFLLTIGVGQVLLPALLFGAGFVAYRLLRSSDVGLPLTEPFIEEKTRARNAISTALIAFGLVTPAVVAAYVEAYGFGVGPILIGAAVPGLACVLLFLTWALRRNGDAPQVEGRLKVASGRILLGLGVLLIPAAGVGLLHALDLGGRRITSLPLWWWPRWQPPWWSKAGRGSAGKSLPSGPATR